MSTDNVTPIRPDTLRPDTPNEATDRPLSDEISHLTKLNSTLDVHQAALLTKCHPDTLRKMAKAREVPATKIGRAWVFSARLLHEWIEARCSAAVDTCGEPLDGSGLAERLARRRAQRIVERKRAEQVKS